MTRSILTGLFAVVSVGALGLLPTSCQSGGIGDPCTPEDEYNAQFNGFKVTEDNIESRSFQCESRICLVNHFQGRVTCPLGHAAPAACDGPGGHCDVGECTEASTYAPYCDDKTAVCANGLTCTKLNKDSNKQGNFCACDSDDQCPQSNGTYKCDTETHQCKNYVCQDKSLGCQSENNTEAQNRVAGSNDPKPCCIPGGDAPVAGAVCGQCADQRSAKQAVYCSCRCGVAEGAPEEPNFHFCDCPDGFECSEIRRDLGIGDKQLSGKYCIKNDTDTTPTKAQTECGAVVGFYQSGGEGQIKCDGSPSL